MTGHPATFIRVSTHAVRSGHTGRFARRRLGDPVDLYDDVRAIALEWAQAQPEPADPEAVSQRNWNATKKSLPEFEDVPNANEVCRQLGVRDRPLPWREVLRIAFDETRAAEPVHRSMTATPDDDTVSDERVFFSMRRVALELGTTSLSSLDYRAGYDQLIERDRRRRNDGGTLEQQLLTFSQIYEHVGWEWSRACAIAELEPPARPRSVSTVDALVRLYRKTGGWPSHDRLMRFAKDHGFALEGRPEKPWHEVIEEARSIVHDADGVEPAPYVKGQRLEWEKPSQPELEPGDAPATESSRYADPEILLSVIRFLEQLARAERPTQNKYETFARKHGLPSLSTLEDRGGLAHFVRLAKRRGARERAEQELHAIRNPTAEQRALQEQERLEALAADESAQTVLDTIRELGQPTAAELLAAVSLREPSIGSPSALQKRLEVLRATGQVKAVPGTTKNEILYVAADDVPQAVQVDDPDLIEQATTPLCRRLHALLVSDGPATAATLAVKAAANADTVGKRLSRLLRAGFVSAEMTSLGRQGRTFTYTATSKPMSPVVEPWSETRRRVYEAITEIQPATLGEIAERTDISKNTITQHLMRLVRDEYLERIPDPARARRGSYLPTTKTPPEL